MLRFAQAEDGRNKIVSVLAPVECRSAISRLLKGGRMNSSEASLALDALIADVRRMVEQPVNSQVLTAANLVIDCHQLRTLDAVQLSCAIVARGSLNAPDMRFIASDKHLLEAARQEGFDIWDPCD